MDAQVAAKETILVCLSWIQNISMFSQILNNQIWEGEKTKDQYEWISVCESQEF